MEADAGVEELLPSLERFIRSQATDLQREQRGLVDREVLSGMAELGLFGLNLPVEYGGSGLDLVSATRVVRRLATWDRSVATTLGLHLGLGTRGLVAFGSLGQKERWLPELASGSRIAAFCATEPNAGSDLAAISTTLESLADRLSLRGSKAYVTNARFAGLFTVLARSPGLGGAQRGHSLVLVDRADSGIELGAEEYKLGLKSSSTAPVSFDVELAGDRVLGEPGAGMLMAGEILAFGRTMMAAGCAGAAVAALSRLREHIEVRKQFGKPLVELEVVRFQLAEIVSSVCAIDAIVEHAAASPDSATLELRSMAAKVFASETCGVVCDRSLQLFGGSGFIEPTGIAILGRDARVTRIFEGANDVLLQKLGAAFAMSKAPIGTDEWSQRVEGLREDARKRFGVRLFGKPLVLHALGKLGMWTELMSALRLRPKTLSSDDRGLVTDWVRRRTDVHWNVTDFDFSDRLRDSATQIARISP